MTERQVTIFLFVPGREWLMTTAAVSSDAELKDVAEEFAKRHGKDKWTELRVYTQQPEWQARRGAVAWNSSGVTPIETSGSTPEAGT